MSIEVFDNIVSKNERHSILKWMDEKDHYWLDQPKAFCKWVDIDKNDWPKEIIFNILKRVGIRDSLELVTFFNQKENCFGLHADTGSGNQNTLGKNIIIPLDFTEDSHTVIFKNKWLYSDVKFYDSQSTPNGDITKATLYDLNIDIDDLTYDKYLKHVERNKLKGLEIEQIYTWKLGDVFTFDRQHIHCAGYLNSPKKSVIIFTEKVLQ